MLDEGAPGKVAPAAQEAVHQGVCVDRPHDPLVVVPPQSQVLDTSWLAGGGRQDGLAEQIPDEQGLAGQ